MSGAAKTEPERQRRNRRLSHKAKRLEVRVLPETKDRLRDLAAADHCGVGAVVDKLAELADRLLSQPTED